MGKDLLRLILIKYLFQARGLTLVDLVLVCRVVVNNATGLFTCVYEYLSESPFSPSLSHLKLF